MIPMNANHAAATSGGVLLIRGRTCYSIPEIVRGADQQFYRVGDRINAGGNAVVHECFEKVSGELFAIKFQVELRDKRRERFAQEVELLLELDDPHIIAYITHGEVEGVRTDHPSIQRRGYHKAIQRKEQIPFVVLPRASESLADFVRGHDVIPTATYLGQFIGLAGALVKVNGMALHRDIKPENVLVIGDTWAISDFGLCDLVTGGRDLSGEEERIGPIFWMSPEALNKQLGCNDQITQASDVFQLASVFWYVTCGRHPCGIVARDDWRGPNELFPVMEKALMHSPQRRFASSDDFRLALVEAIGL
jgi:eukaryotic-like serine/threonine-protein kinase